MNAAEANHELAMVTESGNPPEDVIEITNQFRQFVEHEYGSGLSDTQKRDIWNKAWANWYKSWSTAKPSDFHTVEDHYQKQAQLLA